MKKYRYSYAVGFLLGVVAFVLMTEATASFSFGPSGNERKFDRQVWIDDKNADERMEMIEDLQIHFLRKQMVKSQVLKILGRPNGSGHYNPVYSDTSHVISYDLGYQFLDPCTFDLEFSADNTLVSYNLNCN